MVPHQDQHKLQQTKYHDTKQKTLTKVSDIVFGGREELKTTRSRLPFRDCFIFLATKMYSFLNITL